jgi:metallo-beta-lactamase family protein
MSRRRWRKPRRDPSWRSRERRPHRERSSRPVVERPPAGVLTFLGAAGCVTGSRFLLDGPKARVLVDCGLFQGQKELRLRNREPFPVPPRTIDAVVLTHAHLDHTGYVPALVRNGFRGRIFATGGTVELSRIVLPDSGRLQEDEARHANRHRYSKHSPALPLYTEGDAYRALDRFERVPYDTKVDVAPGFDVRFRRAGHILGAASAYVTLDGEGTIAFSGDLGRPEHPILRGPEPMGPADHVVVESTYGDRAHNDGGAIDVFCDAIVRTAERRGVVVIPAFAVDRTEVVLYHLKVLMEAGRIPRLPVYVDSPMALEALAVYRHAIATKSADVHEWLYGAPDPFDVGRIVEARDVEASKAIDHMNDPCVIVSASGMATGGRVLHHLAHRLPSARNSVLLVGFQAAGTRGRLLADGATALKMLGRYIPVRAEIVDIPAFSVHADATELIGWLATAPKRPSGCYVVHGEPTAAAAMRDRISSELDWVAAVASYRERIRLDAVTNGPF